MSEETPQELAKRVAADPDASSDSDKLRNIANFHDMLTPILGWSGTESQDFLRDLADRLETRLVMKHLQSQAMAERELREVPTTYHVEDNVTGTRASKDFETEQEANAICRSLNSAPGGRYGVYYQDGKRVP